jgi:signal transduction histidine kinase
MLNRLEKAFNIQKSFVHHASHELRTPLASMLLQTEYALRQDLPPEEYKKVLESLKEDQQGLIDLTNSLLSLSQFEKIAAAGSWPEIRVDELLFDTGEAAKKLFKDINISVGFAEVPEDENMLCLKGNDTLLKSAFLNLIKNAYRYSNNKQVALAISASTESIRVEVENTGRQIPEEERSRLFIPFFRGQNAMGKKGFGLGLSIVNRIIHLHVGTVHYEAEGAELNRFVVEFIK